MEKIQTYQDSTSNFEQEILLGDRMMKLIIWWNSRSEAWYMSLEDSDTDDIVSGIKIIPNWALVKQYRANLPNFEGDIIAIPTDSNAEERITYDNLNNGYELNYLTIEELEAWEDYYGVG
jgi:hypothetical protein